MMRAYAGTVTTHSTNFWPTVRLKGGQLGGGAPGELAFDVGPGIFPIHCEAATRGGVDRDEGHGREGGDFPRRSQR